MPILMALLFDNWIGFDLGIVNHPLGMPEVAWHMWKQRVHKLSHTTDKAKAERKVEAASM